MGRIPQGSAPPNFPLLEGVVKIQIVAQISGTRNGADWPAVGGVIDVPADEAAQLISTGLAREPEKKTAPVVETAVAAKAETRKGLTTKSI